MTAQPARGRGRGRHWHNGAVPMREECKFFESRTYGNGETVRMRKADGGWFEGRCQLGHETDGGDPITWLRRRSGGTP